MGGEGAMISLEHVAVFHLRKHSPPSCSFRLPPAPGEGTVLGSPGIERPQDDGAVQNPCRVALCILPRPNAVWAKSRKRELKISAFVFVEMNVCSVQIVVAVFCGHDVFVSAAKLPKLAARFVSFCSLTFTSFLALLTSKGCQQGGLKCPHP